MGRRINGQGSRYPRGGLSLPWPSDGIRNDQGPEFSGRALDQYATAHGVRSCRSSPASRRRTPTTSASTAGSATGRLTRAGLCRWTAPRPQSQFSDATITRYARTTPSPRSRHRSSPHAFANTAPFEPTRAISSRPWTLRSRRWPEAARPGPRWTSFTGQRLTGPIDCLCRSRGRARVQGGSRLTDC